MQEGSPLGKTIIVLLGLVGWSAMAGADPITIVNDQRGTTASARVSEAGQSDQQTASQGPGDTLSATASASTGISVASATATLISSISDPAHLAGTGSARAAFFTLGGADVSAASLFQIDLLLDSPFMYAFNCMFNISDFPGGPTAAFNEAR